MALRVVIFGPGRVGTALAMRLSRRGVDVLGFVGRDPGRTAAAVALAGCGRPLAPADHAHAHVVVFAVGDGELPTAVAAAARASAPRPCSLWLHTSGRFGPEVFDAVPGIRRGALHPVAPFADAASGARAMVGAPGVIAGDASALRLLRALCELLALEPIAAAPGDRRLYHAACALAANGLTGLFAAATTVLHASGVVDEAAARRIASALMVAAANGSAERGPAAALSGPVRRGDAATVALHLAALRERAPAALPSYLATMRLCLSLAESAGLDPARGRALRDLLGS